MDDLTEAIEYFEELLDVLGNGDSDNKVCATALQALRTVQSLQSEKIIQAKQEDRLVVLPAKPRQDCYIAYYSAGVVLPITVAEYRWCIFRDEWIVSSPNVFDFPMADAYPTREEAEENLLKYNNSVLTREL